MASLKDVAREAKVSTATASLALRGAPRITEGTRRRVLEAAERLQYQPSALLRQAMTAMRNRPAEPAAAIAVIGSTKEPPEPGVRDSLVDSARRLGYRSEFFSARDIPLLRLSEILHARRIEGAIMYEMPPDWEEAGPNLFGRGVHALSIQDRGEPGSGIPRVSVNPSSLARIAIRQILSRGYGRPGMVLRRALIFETEFARTAEALMRESRVLVPAPTLVTGPWHEEDEPPLLTWFEEHEPDVIITDLIGDIRGLGIPAKGPLAPGILHTDCEQSWDPENLSGLVRPRATVAQVAVHQLISRIEHGADVAAGKTTLLEPGWRPGRSLRPPLPPRTYSRGPAFWINSSELSALRPLPLDKVANWPLRGSKGWFQDMRLKHFEGGRQVLAGVPFDLLDDVQANGRSAVLLQASESPHLLRGPVRQEVELPVDALVERVYFLHAAAWCETVEPFGDYSFIYETGDPVGHPIHSLARHKSPPPAEVRESACLHDWWRGAKPLENEQTKPVSITAFGNAIEYLARFYVFCWKNPFPERRLRFVRASIRPQTVTALCVLGVTVQLRQSG